MSHPCVIILEDLIDTKDFLFIVLELAEGGELFNKIIERTKMNEVEAKLHFFQIALDIKNQHSKVKNMHKFVLWKNPFCVRISAIET